MLITQFLCIITLTLLSSLSSEADVISFKKNDPSTSKVPPQKRIHDLSREKKHITKKNKHEEEKHDLSINSPRDLDRVEKLAERNHVDAQVAVAEFYLFGPEAYQDFRKALLFLNQAVRRGHLEAIELLAGMYLNGRGVEEDIIRASKIYEVGAIAGHGPCQFNLGIIYRNGGKNEKGDVLKKDPKRAYYWLYKAALNQELGEMNYDAASYRNDVATMISHEERMAIVDKVYKEEHMAHAPLELLADLTPDFDMHEQSEPQEGDE